MMKRDFFRAFSLVLFLPISASATPLTFTFDTGPFTLDYTDGGDYGPKMASRTISYSFFEDVADAPNFTLRGATLKFCNLDFSCGIPSDSDARSSIVVTREGKNLFSQAIDDSIDRRVRWLIGNFGTVYSNASISFDLDGKVSDWSWFLDHDSSFDITSVGGRSLYEQYSGNTSFGYSTASTGTWTRTGAENSSFLAPVPLPASFPVLLLGILSLFGHRRRNRRLQGAR